MSDVEHAGLGTTPDDWQQKRLGEIADLQVGYAFKSAWFQRRNGVRLLRGENVGYGRPDWAQAEMLSDLVAKAYPDYQLAPGDVVIGMDRTFTKSGAKISVLRIDDCPCLLVQRVGKFVPKECERAFLRVLLSSDQVQRVLRLEQKGMDIPHLSRAEILSPVVTLPPPTEQIAIAAAVADIDALLARLDQLITKKRDLKQAAMQQLLSGRARLPGFSAEWEERELRSVVDGLDAGVSVRSLDEERGPNDQCVLKTSALASGTFLPHECKVIAPSDRIRARVNPRRDTILISRMNTRELVGEVAYVGTDYSNLFLPDRIWMMKLSSDCAVFARWLTYLLCSAEYKRVIGDSATGTSGSMKNISQHALLSLRVLFPELQEQQAIATVLSDMDIEIAALEARRDKTRSLKQGMMQELLTGRIRLVQPKNDQGESHADQQTRPESVATPL